jgi:hypothetical protein
VSGENELGTLRVILELLPQPEDVRVHGPGRGKLIVSPHLVQQPIAGDDFASVLDQIPQEIKFLACEPDLSARLEGLPAAQAQPHIAERELLELARPGPQMARMQRSS